MQNKKWLKKAMALMAAAALAMGGAVSTAWAAGTIIDGTTATGSLTIHKNGVDTSTSLEGAEFTIYKVMDLTVTDGVASYSKTADFESVMNGVNPDKLGNYSAEQLENLATQLAGAVSDSTSKVGPMKTDASGDAVFNALPLGYYLVVETAAPDTYVAGKPFLIAIPSTNNYNNPSAEGTEWVYDVTASPKNSRMRLDKELNTADTKEGVSKDGSVKVGDYVPYKITTAIPSYDATYTNPVFTITDVMSDGLEIQDTTDYPVTVTVGGQTAAKDTDYTLTAVPTKEDGKADLTVAFTADYIKAHGNAEVEVTYYALVTNDAVMGTAGNVNEAGLKYSSNPSETADAGPVKVKVYSFGINLVKFTKEDGTIPLAGAEFELYGEKNGAMDTTVLVTGTTDSNGKLVVKELLDEGTYYLKEKTAPEGYTLLANPIKVEITADKDVNGLATGTFTLKVNGEVIDETSGEYTTQLNTTAGTATIAVENHKGFSLPATGGMGIVIFLVVGVAGIIAVSILMTRKTKEN